VAFVETEVSEEHMASITRMEPGTALAVTSNTHTSVHPNDGVTVPPKRRFLQESSGITSQEKVFSIVTAVKTSNLMLWCLILEFQNW
jgi:hypothetical protein